MDAKVVHLLLGTVIGTPGDGALQFLGLKYASVENRLSQARLWDHSSGGTIDATHFGPVTVSPEDGCDTGQALIHHILPHPSFKSSAIDGLNLNITVPTKGGRLILAGEKLPVLVFIHGEGFNIGANTWPQYDQPRIVKLSSEMGLPVIAVNINYRFGLFGFLTSDELRNEGYSSNNGLRDQRIAFLWIKKYISGFGGDPENISAARQSAGGDGDIIPYRTTFESIGSKDESEMFPLPGKAWCESLLIRNCQLDGSLTSQFLDSRKAGIASQFSDSVRKSLPEHLAAVENLLTKYEILESKTDDESMLSILKFATDIGYLAPTLTCAKGWRNKAYVYFFNEPNPWPGNLEGFATHLLDIAVLFQNYNEFLSPRQVALAEAFAEDVIKFCYGLDPWPAFTGRNPGVRLYRPAKENTKGATYVDNWLEGKTGHEGDIFEVGDAIGLDNLRWHSLSSWDRGSL